jgi:hypothetical protein
MRVKEPLVRMIKHVRKKIYDKKMVSIVVANLKMKSVLFEGNSSFYQISGMGLCNKLFYNRSQQHLIDNFLAHIA